MAVGDEHVFPGFLTPVLTQLCFQSVWLLFSHTSEVRGENTPDRKFGSTGYRTRNHRVMSQTRSPLTIRANLVHMDPDPRIFLFYFFLSKQHNTTKTVL